MDYSEIQRWLIDALRKLLHAIGDPRLKASERIFSRLDAHPFKMSWQNQLGFD